MTDYSIGFASFVAIVAIGLMMYFYLRRQAVALNNMARALEDTHMIAVKNRRDEHKQNPFTMNPNEWIAKQVDTEAKVVETISVSQKPMWANLRCDDGKRIVVSPLALAELKAAINVQRTNSKLNQITEPLLGTNRKTLVTIERSLRDDEWFDMEAEKIGKDLGVNWGETARLNFYIISPKAA
jgi:hypothetical protein